MIIKPHEPRANGDRAFMLPIIFLGLVLYWCPTAWFIYEAFTDYDPSLPYIIAFGLFATIVFTYVLLTIIRGMYWNYLTKRGRNPEIENKRQFLLNLYRDSREGAGNFMTVIFNEAIMRLENGANPSGVEDFVVDVERAWRRKR